MEIISGREYGLLKKTNNKPTDKGTRNLNDSDWKHSGNRGKNNRDEYKYRSNKQKINTHFKISKYGMVIIAVSLYGNIWYSLTG